MHDDGRPKQQTDLTDFSAGLAFAAQGLMELAVESLSKAVDANPGHVESRHALGLILAKTGNVDGAIRTLRNGLDLAPHNGDIRAALILFLYQSQQWPEMLAELDLMPPSADVLADQALALNALGRFAEAEDKARAALLMDPEHEKALNNLGLAFDGQERLGEAEAIFKSLPDSAQAVNNLGHVLKKQGRIDDAIACYQELLTCSGDSPQVHFNLSHALLLDGRLPEGLAEYEWRLHDAVPAFPLRTFAQPRWHNEDLAGRTLLVHAEQGFGDSIQFCRFIPRIAKQGRVILKIPDSLTDLLGCLDGVAEIVPWGAPLPPFDLHCPLMSLAYELNVDLADIDGSAYLRPDPLRFDRWRDALGRFDRPRIGLVWAGRRDHQNDRNRTIPISLMSMLWDVPGISWFGLQKDRPWPGPGIDLAPRLESFADTAAVLANLDLVISVDTAVAHLAGALGVPCWLMLPFSPDWRWMLNRDDTPWYDTMKLFRQPSPADWRPVIHHIATDLRNL